MAANFGDQIERRVGGLLDRVPGYRGYRAKEDRRDADRRVRDHVAAAYAVQADRVERIARDLATQRRLMEIGPVDELARTLRHLIDRVRTATYGYGGLMGDRDVDAAALDQLRQFDEGLLSGVDELQGPVAAMEAAFAAKGDLTAPTIAGTAVVRTVLARFDLRGDVVETGKPAPTESVMRVLQAGPLPAAPPAFGLDLGDALAILGDDYLVEARIAIDGDPMALRLFRISGGEERWLAVAARPEQGMALTMPVTPAPPPGGETTIGGTAYRSEANGSGDGEVVGAGGTSGFRPVRFSLLVGVDDPAARAVVLDWSTERRAYAGRQVDPRDVEIFGRPSPQLN